TSSADLVSFTPDTASALTDASGVAVVTVKPTSYTASGAASLSATSVVDSKTGTASMNIAIGAAPLTVGTLSFNGTPPSPLPAFNTVAVNIPITSAGQPATVATGLSLTSSCVGDGSATLVPGTIANGVLVATYTNNGCLRGRDTITASIGNSSQSISLDVSAANIGSIQFTSSSTNGNAIVLKGSGGLGRSESAQLTFKVVDQQNNGLAGVEVDFEPTTSTGGLSVSPLHAMTDASGNVTTMVSSGTIPTPVRVLAKATRNGRTISGLSDALTVSTGLPIQRNMSMSPEHYNIEGGDIDGQTVGITVRLADQYGNPVSDGTTVNFVTEGGAVGTSSQGACNTANGGCSVNLVSQNFRPLDGRVTVLAFVQGIENFVDLNGDGQYTCAGASAGYQPLVDECPAGNGEPFPEASTGELGDMGVPFLDTNENGQYDPAAGDRPFPFKNTVYKKVGDEKWGMNYLRKSIVLVFSGSYATMNRVCEGSTCTATSYVNGASIPINNVAGASCRPDQPLQLAVRLADRIGNPLPFGSSVTVASSNKLTVAAVSPATIGSTVEGGGTEHKMTVTPDPACAAGDFTLRVTTPQGKITEFKFTAN
ncbi:MAG TPA: hypothetical protein DDX04_08575, partial [Massilia sp.]|nr:hypothetical protein [Massilia sp.]